MKVRHRTCRGKTPGAPGCIWSKSQTLRLLRRWRKLNKKEDESVEEGYRFFPEPGAHYGSLRLRQRAGGRGADGSAGS